MEGAREPRGTRRPVDDTSLEKTLKKVGLLLEPWIKGGASAFGLRPTSRIEERRGRIGEEQCDKKSEEKMGEIGVHPPCLLKIEKHTQVALRDSKVSYKSPPA